MFASVGRRLAALNVVVVVAIIAAIGLATYLLLRQSLDREANAALEERIAIARASWEAGMANGQLAAQQARAQEPSGDDSGDEEDDDDDSDDILKSGDTLLFAFDARGNPVANERGVRLDDIPVLTGVERALDGDDDTRILRVEDERVRVRTEPVYRDEHLIGAIQAIRSEREHDGELALIRNVSLVGVALGLVIALPAGLFLARRAMRPIDAVFNRQRAFIADASHELRTPLSVLRANADLVRRLPAPPAQRIQDEMDHMLHEIDIMSALVDDLLALARLDTPRARIRSEPIDVAEIARAAVAALQPQASQAGVRVHIDLVPAFAQANANLVEQVLRILLDNAIKYSSAGDTVTVTVAQRSRVVEIRVIDTGSGIAFADQPHIFDRFYRADQARTRSTGGSGLGLAIARSIVEALGGDIQFTSTPGEGTNFTVTLPAARG